ncbi:MAG: hypothetical protein ACOX7N_05240 [Lawsonibacter sp.]|jgi:hypothetical protein
MWLYILAVILLTLWLVGQIRIGGRLEYSQVGLRVWIRVANFYIRIFPWKKTKLQREKTLKQKETAKTLDGPEKPEKSWREKIGGSWAYIRELVPLALDGVKKFYRAMRVDTLSLHINLGGTDPADLAMTYGRLNGILGGAWNPLVKALHVKNGMAKVQMDFDQPETTVYLNVIASLKLGQAFRMGIWLGREGFRRIRTVQKQNRGTQQQRKAA